MTKKTKKLERWSYPVEARNSIYAQIEEKNWKINAS